MTAYNWYRVYNGTTNDTKWPRLARDTKQNVATIVAVWFALLDCASRADNRGSVSDFSPEDIDVFYGLEDGATGTIMDAMTKRGLITPDGRIAAWDKRQSLDASDTGRRSGTSTDRVRRFRGKKSSKSDETQNETDETFHETRETDETQNETDETDETPYKIREDKIREDNINTPPLSPQGETGVGEAPSPKTSSPKEETPKTGEEPQAEDPAQDVKPNLTHGNPCWKEFCYVFSLWPVQQGKEKAWREYAYLKARHLVPESYVLAEVIERFKAEDRRWKRGYVPMMANWLRDRRWDDVPEKAPAPSYAPDENGRTRYVVESEQDYSQPSRVGSIMDVMA